MIEAHVELRRNSFALNVEMKCSGLTGLTGANGSGKTTFLHLLTGLYAPDLGKIIVNGRNVTELPIQEREVVYLNPDTYFGHLTVDRHLVWGAVRKNKELSEDTIKLIRREIGINFSGKLSALSVGQRSRVILGTALAADPDVIILDELLASISDRGSIMQYLGRVSRKSRPDIIFVSQEESDLILADHVYRMAEGKSELVR